MSNTAPLKVLLIEDNPADARMVDILLADGPTAIRAIGATTLAFASSLKTGTEVWNFNPKNHHCLDGLKTVSRFLDCRVNNNFAFLPISYLSTNSTV